MIWISTLCLLAIAAWLFFNAMNERRWVEAHSHDETVASDEGLIPGFSSRTGSSGGTGKVSIDQEDSGFARAVAKVQNTTSKYGEKLETKIAAAKSGDDDTLFGRTVTRVGESAQKMDRKLDEKLKSASRMVNTSKDALTAEGNLLDRAKHKVSATSDDMGRRMSEMAARRAESREASGSSDSSPLDRIVGGVSGGISKMESKLDEQIAKGRAHVASRRSDGPQEDLLSRVTAKVGSTVSELDKKLIRKNKGSDNSD